jgi:hypothetical protein
MELPTGPIKAARTNPKSMIIFGKPKCGKTTIVSELTKDGSWCLLELEDGGADYVEATKVEARNIDDIKAFGTAVIKAGKPYKGIIIDTVTKMEEIVMPYAAKLYKATPMGASWTRTDVRELPRGAGYLYMRQAFFKIKAYLDSLAHNVIYLGHLSDKMIEKDGEEVSSKELDLTGKASSLMCADVDAIAYCYREENETILNFDAGTDAVCGSRCDHLKGSKIVVATSDEKGVITVDWSKVFLPE